MDNDLILISDTRPSRADAVKNRALILETARRLFEEMGVDAVSMSAVAEAAGVGKGTLYRHFTNKTELCLGLLDNDQRVLQDTTLARLRSSNDPRANLDWFLRAVVSYVDDHIHLLHTSALKDSGSTLEHPAHRWWHTTIRNLLQQAAFDGDLDYVTDTLYVMVSIHALEFQRALGYSRERIVDGLLDTVHRLLW